MVTVITYGTFDLLHRGHIRLLERAKQLGDFLIVGVTADDFDKVRGKINVQQSLYERLEAVKATGLADKIIVEEYEGQKIDDIIKYDVDIFTVGSDWVGKFDYLKDYCEVKYLSRTEGISSSDLRSQESPIKMGILGDSALVGKLIKECSYVNGIELECIYSKNENLLQALSYSGLEKEKMSDSYEDMLKRCDAVFIVSAPSDHYEHIKTALNSDCSVICESPMVMRKSQWGELTELAKSKHLVLMEAIKTAHSTAYKRLILLAKSGKIGKVVSIDCTCTTLRDKRDIKSNNVKFLWNSIEEWGSTAMLPVFQLLGSDYSDCTITKCESSSGYNIFTKIDFYYPDSVAAVKLGTGVKSEGEMIISGTDGYIYVPSPWWKTDYFEIRYEDQNQNKRYFYQLDGEGIRNELVDFVRLVKNRSSGGGRGLTHTLDIIDVFERYLDGTSVRTIELNQNDQDNP